MDQQYFVDLIASSLERTVKRLWLVIILLIVLLVGSNALWIWYESQFDYVSSTEIEQEADNGRNYIVGGDFLGEADG